MDDESKPRPLDYGQQPPKRVVLRTVLMVIATTVICFIVAGIVALFLIPPTGGH